jgi:hypothetical protein
MTDTRARNWFLTLNNYTQDELAYAKEYKAEYLLIADEIGSKEETPHLHIYIELKNQKTFTKIKKEFPRANIQVAKGNAEQVKAYLSKQNLIVESGSPKRQGTRTDYDECKAVLLDNGNMRDVVSVATSYASVRMSECYLKYHERKRTWKPTIKWYYGETESGKSRAAYADLGGEDCDDIHKQDFGIKWWEGYDAHSKVIIDDFRKDFCKFHELLKLLDRYPYRVECKGGSRQFLATHIIITSAYHPEDIYDTREDLQQLLRRIDEIKMFEKYIKEDAESEGSENETETESTQNVIQRTCP